MRAIFRRRKGEANEYGASNNTELAFRKSKGLVDRILDSMSVGKGALASIAFFVLAAMYVFQNEIALRSARTVAKRMKRLCGRLEAGESQLRGDEIDILEGWRWRVISMGR